MSRVRRVAVGVSFVALTTAAGVEPPSAEACAGFSSRSHRVPSLSVEQVLLIHDDKNGVEHFIREITFDGAKKAFGFVVPTPSLPTVHEVEESPFARLRASYPYQPKPKRPRAPSGRGLGVASGGGALGGVKVVSKKRVGSFTAFVLEATDGDALMKWLGENRLETTPASAKWIHHYVALGFHFAAFRYEPPDEGQGGLVTEAVRISFSTPHPYYPYFEPGRSTKDEKQTRRLMSLWFIGTERVQPLAIERGAKAEWKRPFAEGVRRPAQGRIPLVVPLSLQLADLLPDGSELFVQVFQDQKTSRAAFGDVVFVREAPSKLDAKDAAIRERLVRSLDPTLPKEAR